MVLSESEIWISVIIPIFIGPLFVFFKTLYDNSKSSKQTRLKIIFDDKLDKIRRQLSNFYWPIYIRLIIIYQLDYNIPDEYVDNKSDSDSSSCYSECSSDEIETNICRGYYVSDGDYYHKCTNKIPINSVADICKCCRWKSCMKKVTLKIEESSRKKHSIKRSPEFVSINLHRSISDTSINNESLTDNVDEELLNTKLQKELDKMAFLNVSIDTKTVDILNSKILENYKEIETIINNNISIASPSEKLKERLVKLLKYIKIQQIINETKKLNEITNYTCKEFGIKKNINKVLKTVEKKVYQLTDEYRNLIKDGPFNNT
tara:strand:- start:27885 stop:28838 length:954 start_codon:yes stop_codon:yes gene_type:complete